MSEQPQPNPQTVMQVQKQEIDRINDNRVYLMALLEEVKAEALHEIGHRDAEIARLNGVLSQVMSMVDEEMLAMVQSLLNEPVVTNPQD